MHAAYNPEHKAQPRTNQQRPVSARTNMSSRTTRSTYKINMSKLDTLPTMGPQNPDAFGAAGKPYLNIGVNGAAAGGKRSGAPSTYAPSKLEGSPLSSGYSPGGYSPEASPPGQTVLDSSIDEEAAIDALRKDSDVTRGSDADQDLEGLRDSGAFNSTGDRLGHAIDVSSPEESGNEDLHEHDHDNKSNFNSTGDSSMAFELRQLNNPDPKGSFPGSAHSLNVPEDGFVANVNPLPKIDKKKCWADDDEMLFDEHGNDPCFLLHRGNAAPAKSSSKTSVKGASQVSSKRVAVFEQEDEDNAFNPKAMDRSAVYDASLGKEADLNGLARPADGGYKMTLAAFLKVVDSNVDVILEVVKKNAQLPIGCVIKKKPMGVRGAWGSSVQEVVVRDDHARAEAVLLIPDLPRDQTEVWRPTLCKSLADHLEPVLCKMSGIIALAPLEDRVRIKMHVTPRRTDHFLFVDLTVAPKFG